MFSLVQAAFGLIIFLGGLSALFAGTACIVDAMATWHEDETENVVDAKIQEVPNEFARGPEHEEPTLAEGMRIYESENARHFVGGDERPFVHESQQDAWGGF